MRIVKEHDERKNEILDAASRLFAEKGYEQCSVNDILSAVGIAKGTFYYYFKSKEEVLDAVVDRTAAVLEDRARAAEKSDLTPAEKLMSVFMALRVDGQEGEYLQEELHRPENTLLHRKTFVSTVEGITPVLTQVVSDGIAQGDFRCAYPEQYMRIFLISALTLLDDGIFFSSPEENKMRFEALITLLEQMLGVENGDFLRRTDEFWSF